MPYAIMSFNLEHTSLTITISLQCIYKEESHQLHSNMVLHLEP